MSAISANRIQNTSCCYVHEKISEMQQEFNQCLETIQKLASTFLSDNSMHQKRKAISILKTFTKMDEKDQTLHVSSETIKKINRTIRFYDETLEGSELVYQEWQKIKQTANRYNHTKDPEKASYILVSILGQVIFSLDKQGYEEVEMTVKKLNTIYENLQSLSYPLNQKDKKIFSTALRSLKLFKDVKKKELDVLLEVRIMFTKEKLLSCKNLKKNKPI